MQTGVLPTLEEEETDDAASVPNSEPDTGVHRNGLGPPGPLRATVRFAPQPAGAGFGDGIASATRNGSGHDHHDVGADHHDGDGDSGLDDMVAEMRRDLRESRARLEAAAAARGE